MATIPVETGTYTRYFYGRMIQDDYEGAKPWLWLSGQYATRESAVGAMLMAERTNGIKYDIYIYVIDGTLYKVDTDGTNSPK